MATMKMATDAKEQRCACPGYDVGGSISPEAYLNRDENDDDNDDGEKICSLC
jgi:hypothetical protein